MRIAVTGTPGTGKTTATKNLESTLEVIHLNEVIEAEGLVSGHDEDRDTAVVDMAEVEDWLETNAPADVVVESHLAHHFGADRVVVLRCHPDVLETRLENRGEPPATVEENSDSEALDVVLAEAIERHGEGMVYEIETTDRTPDETAAAIDAVIQGEREPAVGTVSYLEDR